MMKIFIIFFFLFSFGCRDYSEFKIDEFNRVSIAFDDSGIENVSNIEWKVGPGFKQTVSKGVLVKIRFPLLEKDNITELDKRNIDSWIVRVSKSNLNSRQVIGYVYIPLRITGTRVVTQRSQSFFNIYYAAASPSPRFENFMCPAFGHQKLIENIELEKGNVLNSNLIVSTADSVAISATVEKFGVRPVSFNAGPSLVGEYMIEISAYNAKKQIRMSNFMEVPGVIKIKSETEVPIKGCLNAQIPEKIDQQDSSRFKFGH